MGATSTARVVRFQARQKSGRMVVPVDIDNNVLCAVLLAARIIDQPTEDRTVLAGAIAKLIDKLNLHEELLP